ncbi:MAG: exonuclease SbcCD subunit D [bacterium]|nr:exonuclease SbcCD subunit D [bacterium]
MKLCHLADSHLGAGDNHPRRAPSGLTVRQEDIIRSFVEAVDRIIEIKPDVCIHAGDLFHAVRPTNRIMAIAVEQFHRLASRHGIPTVIIAGNHDAPKQPHIGAALEVFERIDNLYVAARGEMIRFTLADTAFFALPHCLTTQSLKEQLALCRPDPEAAHNVLIMHGVAAGMPEFSMADLGEQELPVEVMNRFDYTALGHFHNYCQVADRAWYAGSTERLSQSEREIAKGFLMVGLDPLEVKFEEVSTRAMVDLETIDAAGKRGDQLAEIIKGRMQDVDSSDKIVRIKVEGVSPETLKTLPADTLAELKQKAYALDIRFEKEKDETAETLDRPAIGQLDKSFVQFLETVDLADFDRDRLIREALKYLTTPE